VFNRATYLTETLESLLAQSYTDFAIVIVDDASSDDTPSILQRYAALDERIYVVTNAHRHGMVAAWRQAFYVARQRFPTAPYFGWGSDHDVWHPHFLARLIEALDANPRSILAYPLSVRIDGDGRRLDEPWFFDTQRVQSPFRRFLLAGWGMRPGSMVYGLLRSTALERAGVFFAVPLPDRLLLTELALHGSFHQVPQVLWFRRFAGLYSPARQRATLYARQAPAYSFAPWWLVHAAVLLNRLAVQGAGEPQVSRAVGAAVALAAVPLGGLLDLRSQAVRFLLRAVPPWLRRRALRSRLRGTRMHVRRLAARVRRP
jgi:GT2 family glycosyltransferase